MSGPSEVYFFPSADARTYRPNVISTLSPTCLGTEIAAVASAAPATGAWMVANGALYLPFTLSEGLLVTQLFTYNGNAVSGNIDIAIYDDALVRLVTAGTTAQAGTNVIQEFNVTDTYLAPGRYTFGVALDNATGELFMVTASVVLLKVMGVASQATAFVLPNPSVPATVVTHTKIPLIGLTGRSFV